MVKELDEKSDALPDHVGWRLWQASRAWQTEFAAAMRAAGHAWFSEARAGLLGHIPRNGTRQSALIERAAISKQAVQQLLDGLEAEGVLERLPDPRDGRGKLVRYTRKGLDALRDGDHIKLEIERGYIDRIGERRFAALMDALRSLDAEQGDASGDAPGSK
ncbi:MarR family winged helix-turn-helix transcriptional regulator [Mesorhizobium humile]|uniref:MarR family winged helix-turn-helix transcriptional regulator n=1 Tax=Mesorhizobium humile TaxID=3072313 RepID=A0ABU4YNL2_9HYPH|nr:MULTISPECIES: MarR family winged helix-turn-helix transcriptional regulator [unclassified Mesorhizobium]MDX8463151.1 MarR family winged helix-turn-helix transcriptional regulator [Mesorhizobium sp. VK2D]MDX8488524.1 MarR family winged helix-turn-helix transcriptional regulator [Mesorhizobium sp. VK2B]